MFISPEEVDRRFGWPLGRAERLARRLKLPHVVLPDGSVRFDWEELCALIQRVGLETGEATSPKHTPEGISRAS